MLIPPKSLNLYRLCSKDHWRLQLSGVRVERINDRHARAIATDGKVLGLCEWTEDDHSEYPTINGYDISPVDRFATTVDRGQAQTWSKHKGPNTHPILGNIALTEADRPTLASTDLDSSRSESVRNPAEAYAQDAQFPDVDSVFERGLKSTPQMALNPWVLKQAIDTICAMLPTSKNAKLQAVVDVRFQKDQPVWFSTRKQNGEMSVAVGVMPLVGG